MKVLEGTALYILGGVTVVGIVAAFGAGFMGGIYITVKSVANKEKEAKEKEVDEVKGDNYD